MVFSTDTEPNLLRALTSELHFTPTEATWKQWAAMGKMIRVSLVARKAKLARFGEHEHRSG